MRSLLDELEVYQPLVADLSKIKEYREELAVAILLAGLQSDLASQIRRQILGIDSVPTLQLTFSRVLRVSTGPPTSSVVSVSDQMAMAAPEVLVDVDVVVTVASVTILVVATTHLTNAGTSLDDLF